MPFATLRHGGRGSSYEVTLTLWSDPQKAALCFITGRDGHRSVNDTRSVTEGKELFDSPLYPGYVIEASRDELNLLTARLEVGEALSTRLDPDDADYDEEEGWTEASLVGVVGGGE